MHIILYEILNMSINIALRKLLNPAFSEYPKEALLKVTDVTDEQFNSCLRNGYITVDSVTQCISITDAGKNVRAMNPSVTLSR